MLRMNEKSGKYLWKAPGTEKSTYVPVQEVRAKWVPARRNVERFQGLGQGR